MSIKRVWFVSHYSAPLKYEMRIKTHMYIQNLEKQGIECILFAASMIHGTDINLCPEGQLYTESYDEGIHFVHVRCDNYKKNDIKRIKNIFQFSQNFYKAAKHFEKPDVVVADTNCVDYKPIYKYCKQNGVRFYIDMRDLWPLSIVEFVGISNRNPIIQYLYLREKQMYRQATGVIFSMEGGKQYIRDKKWTDLDMSKFHYINNGVDIEKFDSQVVDNEVRDADLDGPRFKVTYAGSIRSANNVKALVEAAEHIKDDSILFLFYGDGNQREELEAYCREKKIANVVFKGSVPKSSIPSVLKKSDLTVLNYKQSETWKYGGSQNKLFEYLAAGKPVLVTIKMAYSLIDRYRCGVSLDKPDPVEIARAVEQIKNMDGEEYRQMGLRARSVAEQFDFKELTRQLLEIIDEK